MPEIKTVAGKAIYLKPVDVADLPAEVQAEAGSLEAMFAVHNAEGVQVAFVASPSIASHFAALNDMTLVALH